MSDHNGDFGDVLSELLSLRGAMTREGDVKEEELNKAKFNKVLQDLLSQREKLVVSREREKQLEQRIESDAKLMEKMTKQSEHAMNEANTRQDKLVEQLLAQQTKHEQMVKQLIDNNWPSLKGVGKGADAQSNIEQGGERAIKASITTAVRTFEGNGTMRSEATSNEQRFTLLANNLLVALLVLGLSLNHHFDPRGSGQLLQ